METCPGTVSPGPTGARLLSLHPVSPSGGQSPLWFVGTGLRVGRSDDDSPLPGQSGRGPGGLATYAGAVRRSRQSHCQLLGLSETIASLPGFNMAPEEPLSYP